MRRPNDSATRIVMEIALIVWLVVFTAPDSAAQSAGQFSRTVTNVAQFRSVSPEDFLDGYGFHLTGILTLVDTNRDLVVLQDDTGAVALHFPLTRALEAGQRAVLDSTNCFPLFEGFPNYPYRPSGRDVRNAFEAPMNWGDYHLNRMRGYLHPPATGEYTFWIASDNSSELWLSTNEYPSGIRRIAFIVPRNWVDPREWSHFPSQRSETVLLQGGRTYYIEAFQEQLTQGDHLSVAWQGPGLNQSLISDRYLTPSPDPGERPGSIPATGISREYWTNYSAGSLAGLTGPRQFEFALTAGRVDITTLGPGTWPTPQRMAFDQPVSPNDNYRWVEVEGTVTFAGSGGDFAILELSDDRAKIPIYLRHWNANSAGSNLLKNSRVRVEGVCEAARDPSDRLLPAVIWPASEKNISRVEFTSTNSDLIAAQPADFKPATPDTNASIVGFYWTRGVVTFSDRVFGKDYLFVQEDAAAFFVSQTDRHLGNELQPGKQVELGGNLQPGHYAPGIRPLIVMELGWRPFPAPATQPVQAPVPPDRDGHWTELAGVVHSVNTNGTLNLATRGESVSLWIGQTPADALDRYVDAKLRVRGVLSLTASDRPMLLIPSRSFVDVEEDAPGEPFGISVRSISELLAADEDLAPSHRVKVVGTVTYRDDRSFFLQDASGGLRIQTPGGRSASIGETLEVVGFPATGPVQTLVDVLVRPAPTTLRLQPENLDLREATPFKQSGKLVRVSANLLAQKTRGNHQVLALQEDQRVFEAVLALEHGALPGFVPGSRLALSGVCDLENLSLAASGNARSDKPPAGYLRIWLRQPSEVALLRGPPWWTLKRTATLIGTLLTVSVGALLWVHLLRRRLERQHAARRTFARQILQGQETERRRIAANLHDSLGQNLLVIKNQARLALQPAAEESMRQRLNDISEFASQAIEEVRQITHGLRPYHLDRLGLTQAVRATVKAAAENSSILFASHADDIDGLFDKESEIHVYRIVQEAVNNILKHSAASEAAVVIKKVNRTLSLSIRDNGRGFDAHAMNSSPGPESGHGLTGITERVRILDGRFAVDSRLGQGTTLTVEIPITTLKDHA